MLVDTVRKLAEREGALDEVVALNSALEGMNQITVMAKSVLVDSALSDKDGARENIETLYELFGGGILIDYFTVSKRHHINSTQRDELILLSSNKEREQLLDTFFNFIN